MRVDWDDVVGELVASPTGIEALLDLDLSLVAKAPGPPVVAVGVDALRESTGARTFGDLVRDPDVNEILRDALGRGERRAFLRALPNVVRRLAVERSGVTTASTARAPREPRALDPSHVPEGGEDLDAWARRFGVEEILASSIRFKVGPRARDMLTMSFREAVDLVRHPHTGGDRGVTREQLRRAAEAELRSVAQRNAPLLDQRVAFLARRRMPDDPWIVERVRLLTERARTHGDHGAAPISLTYPVASAEFRAKGTWLVVREHARSGEHVVDLARMTVTNSRYSWHGSPERARDDRAIVECAIDALCDPDGQALRDLLAWRAIPAWRHMLGAFEEAVAVDRSRLALDEGEERVAFRLPVAIGEVPSVLLQRARKGGATFTAGRQADPYSALTLPGLTSLEREILETITLLHGASYYGGRELARTRLRLLELLAEHPRVHVHGDTKAPVRLRRTRPTLRVIPSASSFRVNVAVGSVALSPAEAVNRTRTTRILSSFDPADGTVYFAESDEVSIALFSALASHAEDLPSEGLDALLGALSSFSDLAIDIDLPEEARGRSVSADPRLVVQLSLANDGSLALAVRTRALPRGRAVVPGAAPRHVYGTAPDGTRVFATRDLDDEDARAEHLLAELPLAGAVRHGPFDLRVDDPERACDVVATLAELGADVVVEWPEGQRLRVVSTLAPRALKLRIERKHDWFGIAGGADVDGASVGIHAMLEAVRAGRRFVRVGEGALVALSRDLRARLARADDVLHDARDGLVAHPPAVSAISQLVDDENEQLAAAAEWLQLRARMKRAETIDPKLPKGLTAELRPYQLEGYRWLMRLAACGTGACLADDMGLGKTVQSLAMLEARKSEGPALVVAPTSVCANWAAEAARFAPGLDIIAYRGAGRAEKLASLGPRAVVVTSYDLMVRDIDALASIDFATTVFDEAHALKNGSSKRALAARRIRADFRLALSGTPIENHTGELWSLFRIIVPGLFGSWERFRERFAAPIERDRDPTRRAALAAVIRPYLLRRAKRDVSPELPPRTDLVRFVDLSRAERDLYEAERLRAIDAIGGATAGAAGEDARFAIFASLTRLRQLACHPRLRHAESTVASSKLASVVALVEELREAGHRALVFSQFTSHLALVADALQASGVTVLRLEGSTPAEARADRVRRFQAGEADVFLISLKAGGLGLNLTAADYVLHLDPWWNPAAEDQASDRAHRIGQDKPVTVVRFIARGTIEESVLALHAEKRELAEAVLAGGDGAARLTMRELLSLMEKSASGDGESEGSEPGDDDA